MRFFFPAFVLLNGFFLSACGDDEHRLYDHTKLAMQPGMRIEAINKNVKVSIEYLSPLKRRYQWDGYDEIRRLIARKEIWLGMRGAYDPASRFPWEFWKPWPRVVAEDSQVRFSSMEEVDAFLYEGSAVLDWVYTDSGLVVGFVETPDRGQVNIEVYQICLNGKRPEGLKGSRPENIEVTFEEGASSDRSAICE